MVFINETRWHGLISVIRSLDLVTFNCFVLFIATYPWAEYDEGKGLLDFFFKNTYAPHKNKNKTFPVVILQSFYMAFFESNQYLFI